MYHHGKVFFLDLNNKTVNLKGRIHNRGNLTVIGSGILQCNENDVTIKNEGVLNLNHSGEIKQTSNYNKHAIESWGNNATVNINSTGSIISNTPNGTIYEGKINLQNGNIKSTNGAAINTNQTFTMTGGNVVQEGNNACIYISGNLDSQISGGTITSNDVCVMNAGAGNIIIAGGTLETNSGASTLYNVRTGNFEITNGLIKNTGTGSAIHNLDAGKIKIKGGTFISENGHGVYNDKTGTIEITGGTISAKKDGVNINKNGSLILGTKDSTVSVETPQITSASTFGIWTQNQCVNFYDGKIIAPEGKTLNIEEADKPDKYQVQKTVDNGIETAILVKTITVTFNPNEGNLNEQQSKQVLTGKQYGDLPIPTRENYTFLGWYTSIEGGTKIESTTTVTNIEDHTLYAHWEEGNYAEYNGENLLKVYKNLKDAVEKATSGNTIKALQNATETEEARVANGKTLTLDINGKTITLNAKLITSGTLTIIGDGLITTTENIDLITNDGGTLNLNHSGTIKNESSGSYHAVACWWGNGININSTGSILANGGNAVATNKELNVTNGTLHSIKSAGLMSAGGNATISGGTVSSIYGNAMYFAGDGELNMTGGYITKLPDEDGVYHNQAAFAYAGSNKATISGGKIEVKNDKDTCVWCMGTGTFELAGGELISSADSLGVGAAKRNSKSFFRNYRCSWYSNKNK